MKQVYEIRTYKQYDRDVKLAVRRGLDIEKLLEVVRLLRQGELLPAKHRNHLLTGDYKGYWSVTLLLIGCYSMRKTQKSVSYPFTTQVLIPTSSVKERKNKFHPSISFLVTDGGISYVIS